MKHEGRKTGSWSRAAVIPAFMLALGLGACGGTPPVEDGTGGSSAVDGGGGSETGGAGGAATGGTTGTSDPEARRVEAEWRAVLAPRTGAHDVWTEDECSEPAAGTTSERIGAEYRVVPTESCTVTATYPQDRTRQCELWPYCESAEDCTEGPGARCEGTPQEATCYYPEVPKDSCDDDADCTAAPDGACVPSDETFCYPTGTCRPPGSYCSYASLHGSACDDDADCTAIPGGECVQAIWFATCRYDTCFEDADCNGGQRCGCGTCVDAACDADSACDDEESCGLSAPTCGRDWGFHCTTGDDECEAGERSCIYEEGTWRDDDVLCE